jgi:hypothetical protein
MFIEANQPHMEKKYQRKEWSLRASKVEVVKRRL